MLGLVLIYFVGKAFYDLAVKHGKHKWGYSILGVGSYYLGLLGGGFLLGIVLMLIGQEQFLMETNEMILGLMAVPVGALCCWGLYVVLKRNWQGQPSKDDQTLDQF